MSGTGKGLAGSLGTLRIFLFVMLMIGGPGIILSRMAT